MKKLSHLLTEYSSGGVYPMHMPGHKRNADILGNSLPYAIDITEISGFDDLHAPTGVIRDIGESLKSFYGCRKSYLLINGSTCGIMAAITSVCSFGDKIIAARNCHRSVYKAIELYGLRPVWVMPPVDSDTGICSEVSAEGVREAIEQNRDAKLVVMTSPTYEGVISDIGAIADACHRLDIPLLCDMAHGAHFPLFGELDSSYTHADIVITSLHKTLPCLTQTACACIYSERVDTERFAGALQIFETSSPSYLLMSSADRCMSLTETCGDELAGLHRERIARFNNDVKDMKHLRVIGSKYRSFDFTKLVIGCNNTSISGRELFDTLRDKYRIECEMASARYIVAMTSICDSDEGLARFAQALCKIDATLTCAPQDTFVSLCMPVISCTAYEAIRAEHAFTPLSECIGSVCGEYILAYPPGVPVIAPGEVITQQVLDIIAAMRESGLNIISESKNGIITI